MIADSTSSFGKARAERIIRESEHSRSARRKEHSGSKYSGRRNRRHLGVSSEEDYFRTRSADKLFREALQGSSSRKLFKEALQGSSSRKLFQGALSMEVLLRGGVVITLAPSMHVCVSETAPACCLAFSVLISQQRSFIFVSPAYKRMRFVLRIAGMGGKETV